jgi:hypothetical protein
MESHSTGDAGRRFGRNEIPVAGLGQRYVIGPLVEHVHAAVALERDPAPRGVRPVLPDQTPPTRGDGVGRAAEQEVQLRQPWIHALALGTLGRRACGQRAEDDGQRGTTSEQGRHAEYCS